MLRCSLFGRWWSTDWIINNMTERIEMLAARRFTTNLCEHKPHVTAHPSFLGLQSFILAPHIRVGIIDGMVDFQLRTYCPEGEKAPSQVTCHRFEHSNHTERQTTAVLFLTHAPSNWFLPTYVTWIEEYCTFVALCWWTAVKMYLMKAAGIGIKFSFSSKDCWIVCSYVFTHNY